MGDRKWKMGGVVVKVKVKVKVDGNFGGGWLVAGC